MRPIATLCKVPCLCCDKSKRFTISANNDTSTQCIVQLSIMTSITKLKHQVIKCAQNILQMEMILELKISIWASIFCVR